jgi:hypothetical protein
MQKDIVAVKIVLRIRVEIFSFIPTQSCFELSLFLL